MKKKLVVAGLKGKLMKDCPGQHGRLLLVRSPRWRHALTKIVQTVPGFRITGADPRRRRFIKIAIRDALPFEPICFRARFEDAAKQDSFSGVRANVRIADPRKVAIG